MIDCIKDITDQDKLYEAIYHIEWEKYFTVNKCIRIDATGSSHAFNNSHFVAQKVKDAIADRFKEKYDFRPNVDLVSPDVNIKVHIYRDQVKVYLSLVGESMHKRGYRYRQGEAPLKENTSSCYAI